eukprot:364389-Chlamydomonas_euryale.AAC.8
MKWENRGADGGRWLGIVGCAEDACVQCNRRVWYDGDIRTEAREEIHARACNGFAATGLLRRVCCDGFAATGLLRRVCCDGFAAAGLLRRVCCDGFAATGLLPQAFLWWVCCGGFVAMGLRHGYKLGGAQASSMVPWGVRRVRSSRCAYTQGCCMSLGRSEAWVEGAVKLFKVRAGGTAKRCEVWAGGDVRCLQSICQRCERGMGGAAPYLPPPYTPPFTA